MQQNNPISIITRGQKWSGSWHVEDGELYVDSAYDSGRERLGRRKPEKLAGEMLGRFVETWVKARSSKA